MGLEIERKFLVDEKQWNLLAKPAGLSLKQGYLVNQANKVIRVRIAGEQAYLTIKGAVQGITRNEYEYEIPVKDGIELLDNFAVSCVEKIRYCINFADKLWEIDVFLGDNNGLIVAEIELEHEDEQFELPRWVGGEVTGEEKYYNSALSIHPYKKW